MQFQVQEVNQVINDIQMLDSNINKGQFKVSPKNKDDFENGLKSGDWTYFVKVLKNSAANESELPKLQRKDVIILKLWANFLGDRSL